MPGPVRFRSDALVVSPPTWQPMQPTPAPPVLSDPVPPSTPDDVNADGSTRGNDGGGSAGSSNIDSPFRMSSTVTVRVAPVLSTTVMPSFASRVTTCCRGVVSGSGGRGKVAPAGARY